MIEVQPLHADDAVGGPSGSNPSSLVAEQMVDVPGPVDVRCEREMFSNADIGLNCVPILFIVVPLYAGSELTFRLSWFCV